MKIKTAIVGCGVIYGAHARELKKLDCAELALVCDVDREKAEKASIEFDVPMCTDFMEVLENPDIKSVHICTPHYEHARMAVAAMEAGKAVLLEKPLALNLEEGRLIVEAQKRTGVYMGVCFQNRYLPSVLKLWEYINNGTLGKILGGRAFVTWSRSKDYYRNGVWRGRWATEGGSLLINQAIHSLDLLQWIFGGFNSVKGTIRNHELGDVIETEDTAELRLKTPNGLEALFYATSSYCENSCVLIEVVFEKGKIRIENDFLLTQNDGRLEFIGGELGSPGTDKAYWGNCHQYLIADFYNKMIAGEAFDIGPTEGLKTMILLDMIYNNKEIIKL